MKINMPESRENMFTNTIIVDIPYGRSYIQAHIEAKRLTGILEARKYIAEPDEAKIIRDALKDPIQSEKLCDLARGKAKVVMITSDHTRPLPAKIMTPIMLKEIRQGNPAADITILVATGLHRKSTQAELLDKFGEYILSAEKIIVHDCLDKSSLVPLGRLPSGEDFMINKLAAQADLLIADGVVEPHVFAGYSGGRKSVLPGIAGKETIMANHCAQNIANRHAKTGILVENPVHADMQNAAERAGLKFILNVALNSRKKIIKAFAGDLVYAHREGCLFIEKYARVQAKPADIVITSNGGYPLDQNIYQLLKGLSAAEATCKDGGVIIMCAECADGHGSAEFYERFVEADGNAELILKKILNSTVDTAAVDQWSAQIVAGILLKHKVLIVTEQYNHEIVSKMGIQPMRTVDEAISKAEKTVGKDATITIIPDGVSVIVK